MKVEAKSSMEMKETKGYVYNNRTIGEYSVDCVKVHYALQENVLVKLSTM